MRVNWLGIIYIIGAVLVTLAVSNLIATAAWVIGVPIGYSACLIEHQSDSQP